MAVKDIIKQPMTFTMSETEDDHSDGGHDDEYVDDDDDDCDGDNKNVVNDDIHDGSTAGVDAVREGRQFS